MENKVNYLDIQLRDMDYRDTYRDMYDKFIDPLCYYSKALGGTSPFEIGFDKAMGEAKSNLYFNSYSAEQVRDQIINQKNGKVSFAKTPIYQIMNIQYKERLKKEKVFITKWYGDLKRKIEERKKELPKGEMKKEIEEYENKIINNYSKFIAGLVVIDLAKAESETYNNQNKKREGAYIQEYIKKFDELIRSVAQTESVLSNKTNDYEQRMAIIELMRSQKFSTEITGGLSSAVYSKNTVSRYLKKQKSSTSVQDELYNYYHDLFNIFFFGVAAGKVQSSARGSKTPDQMYDLLTASKNQNAARKVFEDRFRAFVNKYYSEIDKSELDNYFNDINQNYATGILNIFTKQSNVSSKSFTFGEKQNGKLKYERGVSSATQTQLKKMLEEVFRGVARSNNMHTNHYEDFNKRMAGVVRIDDRYVSNQNNNGKALCYMDLQIKIDEQKAKRKLRLEFQKEIKNEKDPKRKLARLQQALNSGLISEEEFTKGAVDMRHSNVAFEEQLRKSFIDLLYNTIYKFAGGGKTLSYGGKQIKIGKKFLENEEKIIRDSAFKRINGNAKTGKLFLEAFSSYSPEAVKGLVGEIAAAYELRISGIEKIQITGAETDRLKMQKHYDIVFEFAGKKYGMQVKNVKTSDDVGKKVDYTLYRTELGLGTSAMYRYFSSKEVKTYRWLFANGTFLEKNGVDTVEDVKELLTANFLTATPEFLRIKSASELNMGKSIDSDIYLIGNTFYPSSYFIYKAYQIAIQQFKTNAKAGRLFRISGEYPAYVYKADPYLEISKGKYTGALKDKDGNLMARDRSYRINSKGKMEEQKKNLVVIDKSRILYGKKIIFSGITLSL